MHAPSRTLAGGSAVSILISAAFACMAVAPMAFGLQPAAAQSIAAPAAAAQSELATRYLDLVFDDIERTSDIVYGSAIDIPSGRAVDLLLDVYEPAGDTLEERPVFIFIHGGAFAFGDKVTEPRAYCELMARRGYVAISIMYRLNQGNLGTVGIPAAVSDARQAVRWVRANAAEHRLDVDRIGIGGSSAGAITALFLAYTDVELDSSAPSSEVAIVADLWGGLYSEVDQMETGEPPLVIVHGTEDTVVAFSEADALRAQAERVDIPHAFHPLAGVGHAPYVPAETTVRIAEFFFEQLWPGGVEPTAAPTESATMVPTTAATAMATATATTRVPPPTPTSDLPPEPTADPTTSIDFWIYLPIAEGR